jgi:hypothetical protein
MSQETEVILAALRQRTGDAEFGYRMQALFAHTIMRLGWRILAINAKGHPDIHAQAADEEVLIQVKSNAHRSARSMLELSFDDVEGIRAIGRRTGWFALLDCAVPVQWFVIDSQRARSLLGRPLHLATLKANCDPEISATCTRHFHEIISNSRVRLPTLSFHVLSRRALIGDGL